MIEHIFGNVTFVSAVMVLEILTRRWTCGRWRREWAQWVSRTKVARAKGLRSSFQLLCEKLSSTMPHSRKTGSRRKDIWWERCGMLEARRRSKPMRSDMPLFVPRSPRRIQRIVHWRKSRSTKHSTGHKLAAKWAFIEYAMETTARRRCTLKSGQS